MYYKQCKEQTVHQSEPSQYVYDDSGMQLVPCAPSGQTCEPDWTAAYRALVKNVLLGPYSLWNTVP